MRLPSQSLNCEFSRGPKPEKVTSVARRIEERKSGHRHVSRMYHHVSWYPQQLYFGQGAVAHGRGRPSSHTGRELVSRPSHPCAETNSRTRGSFHKGQHPPLLTIMQHIPATGRLEQGGVQHLLQIFAPQSLIIPAASKLLCGFRFASSTHQTRGLSLCLVACTRNRGMIYFNL